MNWAVNFNSYSNSIADTPYSGQWNNVFSKIRDGRLSAGRALGNVQMCRKQFGRHHHIKRFIGKSR